MNKLNPVTSFINLAGTTVLLNFLLSMPAWGANFKVGDSINFDVVVRNQQIGNVKIDVGEYTSKGRQKIEGNFNVTKQPTLGKLVSDLNSQYNLGLDHFNWFQIAEFNPPIFQPGTTNPFIDPPNGGLYKQWADDRPWYWDEYTPTSPPPSKPIVATTNQLSFRGPNTSQKLAYVDSPIDVVPGATFKFHTFLIGVFGGKNPTYDTLGGFEWSAEMQPTSNPANPGAKIILNTQITSLTAGATFTQDYADLIQKNFGYTKVAKLATYSSPGSLVAGKVDSFTRLGFKSGTPFIAWTDNLTGINSQKKPDTLLGAFNQSNKLIKFNDNGGPFKKNLGSGVKSTVNEDGTIRLKVTGTNDLNFDGLDNAKCKPHREQGNYNVLIKLYDTTFPKSSTSSGEGNNCPSPTPTPVPTPAPSPKPCSSASGGGGCVTPAPSPSPTPIPVNSVRPVPTPRPTPRPTPSPSPTPRPTPRPAPAPSPRPAPAPSPRPAPAPSPRPAPAPSPGGRPIRAVPSSWVPNAVVSNLRSSSLVKSSSKANTDYLTAISSDLLEDSELSSTSSNLNTANVAGVSRDLLENPELSSTDSNENQVNVASISSDLLEDSELSSTENNENQVNLAGLSSDLLEDPELSSADSDENNADLADISADLLEDPELSSEDHNSERVDLATISADLLEDPELSYLDDTLTAQTPKVLAKNTDDDALSAEAVPEPTTGLGTLLALGRRYSIGV